jgi:hypothetical protein
MITLTVTTLNSTYCSFNISWLKYHYLETNNWRITITDHSNQLIKMITLTVIILNGTYCSSNCNLGNKIESHSLALIYVIITITDHLNQMIKNNWTQIYIIKLHYVYQSDNIKPVIALTVITLSGANYIVLSLARTIKLRVNLWQKK